MMIYDASKCKGHFEPYVFEGDTHDKHAEYISGEITFCHQLLREAYGFCSHLRPKGIPAPLTKTRGLGFLFIFYLLSWIFIMQRT